MMVSYPFDSLHSQFLFIIINNFPCVYSIPCAGTHSTISLGLSCQPCIYRSSSVHIYTCWPYPTNTSLSSFLFHFFRFLLLVYNSHFKCWSMFISLPFAPASVSILCIVIYLYLKCLHMRAIISVACLFKPLCHLFYLKCKWKTNK